MSDERCALVLEGGAMRGMYTAGVLDCFMDHDISFDAVIGVSAGALFGVNLLSKQRGRVIRYNKRFNSDKNYGYQAASSGEKHSEHEICL